MTELYEAVEKATAEATSYSEGLRLSLDAIIPLANRQWFLAQDGVDTHPDIAAAYQADRAELAENFERAKDEGGFASDVPVDWLVQSYENLVYAAWLSVRDEALTPRQASDLVWRTLTSGLSGDAK